MQKPEQIAYNSILSTSRRPRWWILGLVQVVAFSIIGEVFRPQWPIPLFAYWLICAVIIIIPCTVWLWQEIEAVNSKKVRQVSVKVFIRQCLSVGAMLVASLIIVAASRMVLVVWVLVAVASSLVAATAILAMLYSVLCGQLFFKALTSAMYTWNKKTSMGAIAALILILAHGVSFALVNSLRKSLELTGQFSLLSRSATIWILLAAIILLVGFIAAVLNCFLVSLFLEIIRTKKAPEVVEETVPKLTTVQAHH